MLLATAEAETRLHLLDTQIEMTKLAAGSVNRKAIRVRWAVACLAGAAALIVIGTLTAEGQASGGKSTAPPGLNHQVHTISLTATSHSTRDTSLPARPRTDRVHWQAPRFVRVAEAASRARLAAAVRT
jgi:hypothetical protein